MAAAGKIEMADKSACAERMTAATRSQCRNSARIAARKVNFDAAMPEHAN
jgi:hypothetical protein